MADEKRQIYTVSQVTSLISGVLEKNLPASLTITGEISNFRRPGSGHCYFDLKEEQTGQIVILHCVMWRSNFTRSKFEFESGLSVLAQGRIEVYAPQGKYQFHVESITPAGIGALQVAFEQMVKRLESEGLFADEHKKLLPRYPDRICIVTSESGAAVHDITDSIWNRWPCVELVLYPVPVQGEGAAEKIAAAIRDINRRNSKFRFDMMIIGRGGGSLEDLWAFNEEVVARAIYDSKIPIVSAVGHEIDTTIADLVADVRASTPTKAGVVAVPDIEEVSAQLKHFARSLSDRTRWKLQLGRQKLDELSFALSDSVKDMLAISAVKINRLLEHVRAIEPHRLMRRKTVELSDAQSRAAAAIKKVMNKLSMQLTASENRLAAMNPKSVLQRGYSITKIKKSGLVVRTKDQIEIADLLVTELANENFIESQVTKLDNNTG